VLVNKIDRQDAEPLRVHDEVLQLFLDLEATPEQFNCPFLYTSSRAGTATFDLKAPGTDLKPLFQTILDTIPPPTADRGGPFQMLVSTLDYSSYRSAGSSGARCGWARWSRYFRWVRLVLWVMGPTSRREW
jgi:GTP-binding protein